MKLLHVLFFIALSQFSRGNHTVGADLSWEYLGNDKYKVMVTLIRDCNGLNAVNTPIKINGACSGITSGTQTMSSAKDITPICPSQCSRCTSGSCSFPYGYDQYILTTVVDVSTFKQNGCCNVNIVWSQCCRPGPITGFNDNFYLDASLDVCVTGGSNSPKFETAPPTLVCLGGDIIKNLGAIDIDTNSNGQLTDSLVYTLVGAKVDSNQLITGGPTYPKKPIGYLGYPNNYPFSKFPFGFHFDSTNAQVFFRPMRLQTTQWVIQVEEYRNGKKIGHTKRDFQMTVLKCPNNKQPVLSGAQCRKPLAENFDIYACAGQPISIKICTSDKDASDTVTLTCEHSIAGASYAILGSKRQSISFSWTPKTSDIRTAPYSFVVKAKDDACPVRGEAERIYHVYVGDTTPFQIFTSLEPIDANCGEFWLKARTTDNVPSHQWNWYLNDTLLLHSSELRNARDSFKYKFDTNGVYNITIKSNRSGCFETFKRSINMTGLKPIRLPSISDTSLCKTKRLNRRITATGGHGPLSYSWMNSDLIHKGQSDTINFLLAQPHSGSVYTRKISYSVVDTAGCTASDKFEVLVKRKENLELMGDTVLCGNDIDTLLPLKSNSSLQGSWSGEGFKNGRFSSKNLPRKLYKLQYYGENAKTCVLDTVDIGVYHLPKVNAGRDLNGCPNMKPIKLNGVPSGGTWSGTYVSRNEFSPPKNISGSFSFTYSYQDMNGCQNSDTNQLTVLPYKANVDAGNDTFLCGQVGLHQLSPSPNTGTWKGFNLETKNGNTFFNSSFAQIGRTYSLVFDGYDSIGCMNSDTMTITMKAKPYVNAGLDLKHCFSGPKDEVQLNGQPKGGTWSGNASANAAQKLAIDSTHIGVSNYEYKVTDSIGCTNTDELTLTVRSRPKVFAGTDDTICLSNATYYNLIGLPNSGVWNGPGIKNSSSSSRVLLHNALLGQKTYTFSLTDQFGCSNVDSLYIYVGTKNDALFTPSSNFGKAPLTVTFKNESFNANSYLWDFGNGNSNSDFEPTTTYSSEGKYAVSLTTIDGTGFCSSTHFDTIVVNGNVSVNNLPRHAIKMYPNPTNGLIKLQSNMGRELRVEVLNASGSLVSSAQMNEQITLNLESLPAGLYLMKITDATGLAWTSKLQVE